MTDAKANLRTDPETLALAKATVEVAPNDLQGPGVVFCPNPKMALWSNHPRVFIDVATTGHGKCSYCGTVYKLKGGAKVGSH
ncbi:zinc-finger domain-containing protein [soil metagenome]